MQLPLSLGGTMAAIMTYLLAGTLLVGSPGIGAAADNKGLQPAFSADLDVAAASVKHLRDLDILVFEMQVKGKQIAKPPQPRGQLDGAPVLAYVFATSLKPAHVGFGPAQGTLALAVTSHPDFDDTPLWDENSDGTYDNDGRIYHSHWVVLVPDTRVGGGLSVGQFKEGADDVVLPPTNPGMPIYLDSPGFSVMVSGNRLKVIVPAFRIQNQIDFKFDAVTSYLQVNTSDDALPMLGVYHVYHVLSGDLSLPYRVQQE